MTPAITTKIPRDLDKSGAEKGSEKRLTPRQAAEYLNVSLRTLYTFPLRKFKRGRVVRYDTRDLEEFLALNTVGPAKLPSLRRIG